MGINTALEFFVKDNTQGMVFKMSDIIGKYFMLLRDPFHMNNEQREILLIQTVYLSCYKQWFSCYELLMLRDRHTVSAKRSS